ncbi:helix-turn-helix domain-containing protein [Oerskovia paurometabola]|uniref:helix-turn-helix domain-containing protein n=1 Tax=Oerskovia paurometabola TaxID=162170 RepID=UPI003828627F
MDTANPPNPSPYTVAAVLSDAIEAAGKSQRQVATEAGIAHTTLHRRLSGDRVLLLDEVGRIGQAVGRKTSDLLREAEDRESRSHMHPPVPASV